MLSKSTAGQVAGPSTELELVNYGAGWAWLRPEPHPVRVVHAPGVPLSPGDRVALTQRSRDLLARWRAERWLFGAEVTPC